MYYSSSDGGRYVTCFGCERNAAWKENDNPFPVYCAACKTVPKITKDEVLNIHEDLQRIKGFIVEGGDIEPSV